VEIGVVEITVPGVAEVEVLVALVALVALEVDVQVVGEVEEVFK